MKIHTYTIQQITPKSIGIVSAVIAVIVGGVAGIIIFVSYSLYQFTPVAPGSQADIPSNQPVEPGTLSLPTLLLIPVLYGLFGYFIGYVGAVLYNILARRGHGIIITLREEVTK